MKTSTKQTLKVVLLLIALFAAAGIGVLSYVFHKQVRTLQIKALDAIPNHTALFFETARFEDFLSFNADAQPLFTVLFDEKQQKNLWQMLWMLKDVKFGFDMEKYCNAFYLSVHFQKKNRTLLFGIEVDKRYNKELKEFVKRSATQYAGELFSYKGNEILKLHHNKEILYLNRQNGLLLLSSDESLLRASIDKIVLKDSALHHIVQSFAHKRDADVSLRVYLQHAQCEPVFRKILEETGADVFILPLLSPFSWSALNVARKNETVIFSGYAKMDTTANKARLFTHSDKTTDIEKLLPCNAQNIFYLNAGRYQRFSQIKPCVQTSEDVFGLMYPSQVISFEMNSNDTMSQALLLVSENPLEAAFHLFNSVNSEFSENQYHLDTFYVHTAMIGKINLHNFIVTRLGFNRHFPKLCYYTIWDNCVVFTDTKEGMISYIQSLREGNTLKMSEKYQALSPYFSSQANVLYYNDLSPKTIQNIRFQYDYFSGDLFLMDAVVTFLKQPRRGDICITAGANLRSNRPVQSPARTKL